MDREESLKEEFDLSWLYEESDKATPEEIAARIKSISEKRRKIHLALFNRDNGKCFYCEKPLRVKYPDNGSCYHDSLTMDHIIQKAHGGSYSLDNLVSACTACNGGREKRKFTAEQFLVWRWLERNLYGLVKKKSRNSQSKTKTWQETLQSAFSRSLCGTEDSTMFEHI